MKIYFIKYKLFVGEGITYGENSTSIEARSKDVAIRKLERQLKKAYGISFNRLDVLDTEVIGYF